MFYGKVTKQPIPISMPAVPEQVKNKAGGYAFKAEDSAIYKRFLILGTEGGTYYTGEQELTLGALNTVNGVIDTRGEWAVNEAWRVYENGLALKQSAVLYALAYALTRPDLVTRKAVYAVLPQIRTASQLFELLQTARHLAPRRTSSMGLRKAISRWYADRKPEDLAYQLVKYQVRNNMSHRDLMRWAHPTPSSRYHGMIFNWVMGRGWPSVQEPPKAIVGFEAVHTTDLAPAEAAKIITTYSLPREAVPTEFLNERVVWEALLENMPMTALIRNLGKISSLGFFDAFSPWTQKIANQLTNQTAIQKAHVHPLTILKAAKQYEQGHGDKGSLSWSAHPAILDALDQAFRLAYVNVEPLDKRIVVAVDASGSMTANVSGMNNLTAREAAVALALVYKAANPLTEIVAFSDFAIRLPLSGRETLSQAMYILEQRISPSSTNASLVLDLIKRYKWPVDGIVFVTDSESWLGHHVYGATSNYKVVTVQTLESATTLFRPNDPNQIELPGFGPDIPQVANLFFQGEL